MIRVLFGQRFVLCYSAYSHWCYQLFSPSSLCMFDRLWLYTMQTRGLSQAMVTYLFIHEFAPPSPRFILFIFISIGFIVILRFPISFYHTTSVFLTVRPNCPRQAYLIRILVTVLFYMLFIFLVLSVLLFLLSFSDLFSTLLFVQHVILLLFFVRRTVSQVSLERFLACLSFICTILDHVILVCSPPSPRSIIILCILFLLFLCV